MGGFARFQWACAGVGGYRTLPGIRTYPVLLMLLLLTASSVVAQSCGDIDWEAGDTVTGSISCSDGSATLGGVLFVGESLSGPGYLTLENYTVYVNASGNDTSKGIRVSYGTLRLRDGSRIANAGAVGGDSGGRYVLTVGTSTHSSRLEITDSSVQHVGWNHPSDVYYRGIHMGHDGILALDNATVSDGYHGVILGSEDTLATITNSTLANNTGSAIYVTDSHRWAVIEDNRFENNAYGVSMYGDASPTSINISRNTAIDNNQGVIIGNHVGANVSHNRALNNTQHGFTVYRSNLSFHNNTATGNGFDGLRLSSLNLDVAIHDNLFCHNNQSGGFISYYDIENSSSNVWGAGNTCDTVSGWNDDGETGCTYACPSLTAYASCDLESVSNGQSITLTEDYNCSGTFYHILHDNVALDCAGHTITGEGVGSGVNVSNAANVTVENCVFQSFERGIYYGGSPQGKSYANIVENASIAGIQLGGSSDMGHVAHNEIRHSANGIVLSQSRHSVIENNTIANGTYSGFYLSFNENTTVQSNHVTNCSSGYTSISANNAPRLDENTFTDIRDEALELGGDDAGVYAYNAVIGAGKNCVYIGGGSTASFVGNALSRCGLSGFNVSAQADNNSFVNNSVRNASLYGFYFGGSDDNSVINNSAQDNGQYGFYFASSDRNDISENNAANNTVGFLLGQATLNNLSGNIAPNNSFAGFSEEQSSYNLYVNNTAQENEYGFYVQLGGGSTYSHNTAYANNRSGFVFSALGTASTLTANNATNNAEHGFYLSDADDSILSANHAGGNGGNGFSIHASDDVSLEDNTGQGNSGHGFHINATGSRLTNDTAQGNALDGFRLTSQSLSAILDSCTAAGNRNGFFADQTSGTIIRYSVARDNSESGFHDTGSTFPRISVNFARLNTNGFVTNGSINPILDENNATNNTQHGFRLYSTTGASVTGNLAENNTRGFSLQESDGNTFDDTLANSNDAGIELEGSDSNQFTDTNISGVGPVYTSNGIWLTASINNSFERGVISDIGGRGVRLEAGADNNTFEGLSILSCQPSIRISASENNHFIDCVLEHDTEADDAYLEDGAYNTLFLNTSHDNESIEIPYSYPTLYSDANLTVQWYLDVLVEDQDGVPVGGADVMAWDNASTLLFSLQTSDLPPVTGRIGWQNVTEYVKRGTASGVQTDWMTPHRIDVSHSDGSFDSNSSHLLVNESMLYTVIINRAYGSCPPQTYFDALPGDWLINTSIRCVNRKLGSLFGINDSVREVSPRANVVVQPGGALTLINATLKINGGRNLIVEENGSLYLLDTDDTQTGDESRMYPGLSIVGNYIGVAKGADLVIRNSEIRQASTNNSRLCNPEINASGASITGSAFHQNLQGLCLAGTHAVLENNTFYSNDYYGLTLSGANHTTAAENEFYGNGAEGGGISLAGLHSAILTRNVIHSNDELGYGIRTLDCFNVSMEENSVSDHQTGFISRSGANLSIIDNHATRNSYGFSINSHNTSLMANSADNNTGAGFLIHASSPRHLDDCLIDSNNATENPDGFLFFNIRNATLSGNLAANNTLDGFEFNGSTALTIQGNTAQYNGLHGFLLVNVSDATLANNTANENAYWGFYQTHGSNNTYTGNIARDHDRSHFYANDSSLLVYESNTLQNGSGNGFECRLVNQSYFRFNTVSSVGGDGINSWGGTNNTYANNVIEDCIGHGLRLAGGSFIVESATYSAAETNPLVTHNVVENCSQGFMFDYFTGLTLENNTARANRGDGVFFGIMDAGNPTSSANNTATENQINGFTYANGSVSITASSDRAVGNALAGFNVSFCDGHTFTAIESRDNDYGFIFSTTNNISIIDSSIVNASITDVYLPSQAYTIVLLNTTHDADGLDVFDGNLTIQWWFNAHVNDSNGTNVTGAQVALTPFLAYQPTDAWTTNADGITGWHAVTDKTITGFSGATATSTLNPYTLDITATDYHNHTNDSVSVNQSMQYFATLVSSLDTAPPNVTITDPSNNSVLLNGTFSVNYTVVDNESLIDNCTLAMNGTDVQTADISMVSATPGDPLPRWFTLVDVGEGIHEVSVRCVDEAGNEGISAPIDVRVHLNAAPVVSILSPTDGYYSLSSTVDVSYTVSDEDSASMSNCTLTLEGARTTLTTLSSDLTGVDIATDNLTFHLDGLANDSYQYNITCTDQDAYDPQSTTSEVRSFTVDVNALPEVTYFNLTPEHPRTNDNLTCSFQVVDTHDPADPDSAGATLTATMVWHRNATLIHTENASINSTTKQHQSLLLSSNTSKADTINCTVTAFDGYNSSLPSSRSAVVRNTPPTVSGVSLQPSPANDTDNLTCDFANASDADGDPITLHYRWIRDNTTVAGLTDAALSSGNTSSEEKWQCAITPNDGADNGSETSSQEIIIGASNINPVAASTSASPTPTNVGESITYSVEWSDSQGDAATLTVCSTSAFSAASRTCTAVTLCTNASSTDSPIQCSRTAQTSDATGAITYHAFVCDSQLCGQSVTGTYSVNHAPTIATTPLITATPPGTAYTTSNLTCTPGAVSDPDGTTTTQTLTWYRNDTQLAEHNGTLTSGNYTKHDLITCQQSVTDAHDLSAPPRNSTAVEIDNSPPILDDPGRQDAYEYLPASFTLTATDADEDPIAYTDDTSLFTVDATTGLVSLTPENTVDETHTVTYTATDAEGASDSVSAQLVLHNRAPRVTSFQAIPGVDYVTRPATLQATINDSALQSATVRVTAPNGTTSTHSLLSQGGGSYSAFYAATQTAGTYTATVTATDAGGLANDTQQTTFRRVTPSGVHHSTTSTPPTTTSTAPTTTLVAETSTSSVPATTTTLTATTSPPTTSMPDTSTTLKGTPPEDEPPTDVPPTTLRRPPRHDAPGDEEETTTLIDFETTVAAKRSQTPTCTDGKQNQGEQNIDCGGPCPPCPPEKPRITVDLESPRHVYLGDTFTVSAAIKGTTGTLEQGHASLESEPPFSLVDTAAKPFGELAEGATKTVSWTISTTNETPLGTYTLIVTVAGAYKTTARAETRLLETYVSTVETPIDVQERTLENMVFNSARTVYATIVRSTTLWLILLLVLFGFGYLYYRRRQTETPIEQYLNGTPNKKRYTLEKGTTAKTDAKPPISEEEIEKAALWREKREAEQEHLREIAEENMPPETPANDEKPPVDEKPPENQSTDSTALRRMRSDFEDHEQTLTRDLDDLHQLDQELAETLAALRADLADLDTRLR